MFACVTVLPRAVEMAGKVLFLVGVFVGLVEILLGKQL